MRVLNRHLHCFSKYQYFYWRTKVLEKHLILLISSANEGSAYNAIFNRNSLVICLFVTERAGMTTFVITLLHLHHSFITTIHTKKLLMKLPFYFHTYLITNN